MKIKDEFRDLNRTLNESPAACALGAIIGIGGAAALFFAMMAIAGICHTGL